MEHAGRASPPWSLRLHPPPPFHSQFLLAPYRWLDQFPAELREAAQPGRPCALFWWGKTAVDAAIPSAASSSAATVPSAATSAAPVGARLSVSEHRPSAVAAASQTIHHLPLKPARAFAVWLSLVQRGVECFWAHWGLDVCLLLLLLAACLTATAPSLMLLPFVAAAMAAPKSKHRCVYVMWGCVDYVWGRRGMDLGQKRAVVRVV